MKAIGRIEKLVPFLLVVPILVYQLFLLSKFARIYTKFEWSDRPMLYVTLSNVFVCVIYSLAVSLLCGLQAVVSRDRYSKVVFGISLALVFWFWLLLLTHEVGITPVQH